MSGVVTVFTSVLQVLPLYFNLYVATWRKPIGTTPSVSCFSSTSRSGALVDFLIDLSVGGRCVVLFVRRRQAPLQISLSLRLFKILIILC